MLIYYVHMMHVFKNRFLFRIEFNKSKYSFIFFRFYKFIDISLDKSLYIIYQYWKNIYYRN